MRRKRGFTIVETLVALGLLVIIFGLGSELLRGLKSVQKIQSEVSAISREQRFLDKSLETLFLSTESSGIHVTQDPPRLALQTLKRVSSGGKPQWSQDIHLLWYDKDQETLSLKRIAIADAGLEPLSGQALSLTDTEIGSLLPTAPLGLRQTQHIKACRFELDETRMYFSYEITAQVTNKKLQFLKSYPIRKSP